MTDRPAAHTPNVGDQIYVRTSLHIRHGEDDVIGGLATVSEVSEGISNGRPTVFVSVHEHPGHSYNWYLLSEDQKTLAADFGTARAHQRPDLRPQFNDHWGENS